MQEDYDPKRFLIVLMLITFILGALVLVFKSDFRIQKNRLSNIEYYPHIKIEQDQE